MALAPNALTTLATAKGELGISGSDQDAVIERIVNVASGAIERYCHRAFGRATVTELHRGGIGVTRLVLARTPAVEIVEVREAGVLVDPAEYSIEDAAAGLLYRGSGWPADDRWIGVSADPVPGTGSARWSVEYTGGYVLPKDAGVGVERDLPYELEEACLLTVVSQFRARGKDRRVSSESVGDASVTYGGVNTAIGRGAGGIIPDDVATMLQSYVRLVIA